MFNKAGIFIVLNSSNVESIIYSDWSGTVTEQFGKSLEKKRIAKNTFSRSPTQLRLAASRERRSDEVNPGMVRLL